MSVPSIDAKTVAFTYDTEHAEMVVSGLDLQVRPHEVVCLFGPNGCGKSTLLKLCAGLLVPTAGEIRILGRAPGEVDLGYLPQTFGESLFPWLTVLQNVAFPPRMQGAPRRVARERAMRALQRLPQPLPILKRPDHLSIGQQQLACLARALVLSPRLVLADEPFSALDFRTRHEMQDVFQHILAPTERIAALFASHQVEDAVYLADRVVVASPRPLRVWATFDVGEPRPRGPEYKRSASFFRLCSEITEAFLEATQV